MSAPTASRSAARLAIAATVSSRWVGQAVRDEVGEELLVPLLVPGDPADQVLEHRLVDLRLQVAAEHGVRALEERHERQRLDLAVRVGAVALHHVLDADVLVGGGSISRVTTR